jgi:hypothetical protein
MKRTPSFMGDYVWNIYPYLQKKENTAKKPTLSFLGNKTHQLDFPR